MKNPAPIVIGGIVGAAEISSIIFWGYLASLGEKQSQIVFRNQPPNEIFLWAVPLGALTGVCCVVSALYLSKRGTSSSKAVFAALLPSTVIGFPTSYLWAYISAFSLPTASSALLMSVMWLVLTIAAVFVTIYSTIKNRIHS